MVGGQQFFDQALTQTMPFWGLKKKKKGGDGRRSEGEKERGLEGWTYGFARAVQFNGGGDGGLLIVTAQIHMGMGGIVWE